MSSQFDFKKEIETAKKHLQSFSQEAGKIAKRGEKEILEISRKGKIYLDTTANMLKKEHLYFLIGKEYVNSKDKSVQSATLKKYLQELNNVEKANKDLKKQLKHKKKRSSKQKEK